jgi:hypothetical protein
MFKLMRQNFDRVREPEIHELAWVGAIDQLAGETTLSAKKGIRWDHHSRGSKRILIVDRTAANLRATVN